VSAREYSAQVRRARERLRAAQEAQLRCDDANNELQVRYAREHLWRALFYLNPSEIPDSVREARRRFDEDTEDHDAEIRAGDPIAQERNLELMRQATDAECAAGIHSFCACRHVVGRKRGQSDVPPPDEEDPVTEDWFDARRAQVWAVIQPDGSVVAKGFVGDETADEDMAVHPAGSLAYYSPQHGWTNAATGYPAARVPAPPVAPPRHPDDLRRGRWYDDNPITTNTGSAGGAAMASIEEVRAGLYAGNELANEGLGALQHAHAQLEQAQGAWMRATEGSGQADVSTANGLIAQAVASIEEVRQQVSAAISASEDVGNRL
jgi:hypothetical protein